MEAMPNIKNNTKNHDAFKPGSHQVYGENARFKCARLNVCGGTCHFGALA